MHLPRTFFCLALLAAIDCLAPASAAEITPASPTSVSTLPMVVVRGTQPGPGLWKVSRDGGVVWILGVISPLPKHMQWASAEVEKVIAGSQQVLQSPR